MMKCYLDDKGFIRNSPTTIEDAQENFNWNERSVQRMLGVWDWSDEQIKELNQ